MTENVTLFGHVLTLVCLQLTHCIRNVGSSNDGVALEYAPCFPTPYSLDHSLRDSRTPEIARRAVVEELDAAAAAELPLPSVTAAADVELSV